jgi:hypothetical protein
MVTILVSLVAGFVAGVLVGRKNAAKVTAVVDAAEKV